MSKGHHAHTVPGSSATHTCTGKARAVLARASQASAPSEVASTRSRARCWGRGRGRG